MQVKKQQLELDMEQQTGSKSGKEYIKAVYCHPAYFTYMWNLKNDTNECIYKIQIKTKNKLMVTKGNSWRREGELN